MVPHVLDDPRCPKCHATTIAVLTFSDSISIWVRDLRCAKCGHVWAVPQKNMARSRISAFSQRRRKSV